MWEEFSPLTIGPNSGVYIETVDFMYRARSLLNTTYAPKDPATAITSIIFQLPFSTAAKVSRTCVRAGASPPIPVMISSTFGSTSVMITTSANVAAVAMAAGYTIAVMILPRMLLACSLLSASARSA